MNLDEFKYHEEMEKLYCDMLKVLEIDTDFDVENCLYLHQNHKYDYWLCKFWNKLKEESLTKYIHSVSVKERQVPVFSIRMGDRYYEFWMNFSRHNIVLYASLVRSYPRRGPVEIIIQDSEKSDQIVCRLKDLLLKSKEDFYES